MAATIRDVARAAGVSPSTVSRALSMPDVVSPVTRDRVHRAAERLGYAPNRAARGLITGRTGNLGLVVPDLANPFFPEVVKSVQARAREADCAVLLADTDEDAAAEVSLARSLVKQVDGLVLCSPRMDEEDLRGVTGDVPVVLLNRRCGDLPAVSFDNVDGMRQAVAHLQALGHRSVAWVGGPEASWSHGERLTGLRTATERAGLRLVEVGAFPPYFEGGVAAADQVVASGVTSVVAFNDVMALGLLSRLQTRGVAVPDDLSVVGVDDIPLSGMVSPSLTTVGLAKERAGRQAVDLLLALLRDPERARDARTRRELAPQLLVRGSTGVVRTG
jgi:LacI family transcriptional regulator